MSAAAADINLGEGRSPLVGTAGRAVRLSHTGDPTGILASGFDFVHSCMHIDD